MARKARIDAPGAFHNIICRGRERRITIARNRFEEILNINIVGRLDPNTIPKINHDVLITNL